MGLQIGGNAAGRTADVSSDFRLLTESKSRESEEVEAEKGRSFILHGECHLAVAASGALISFENTSSDEEVIITRLYIDSHTITPTDLIITMEKGPTITNGTDISSTGVIQKNFGRGDTLTGTLKISDSSSDMTFTGGANYHAFPVQTMSQYTRDVKGSNVISPGKIIGWGWKTRGGGNAVDGEIVSLSINCFKRKIIV